jgi:hypothetical protein
LGRATKAALKKANLGIIDRSFGAGLGFIRSILTILLIIMLLMITPLKQPILMRAESEPVLKCFTNVSKVIIDRALKTSPKQWVHQTLESWGFDQETQTLIFKDPQLVTELAKSWKSLRSTSSAKVDTVKQKAREKFNSVRERVISTIQNTKLSARQRANTIDSLMTTK